MSPAAAVILPEEVLDAIADRVVAKLQDAAPVSAILTTAQAMRLTGCGSDSAFSRWCIRWGVRNSGLGRWPLHRINAGLQREAMQGKTPRPPRQKKNSESRP